VESGSVTVVVDCYNHEPYVEAALASVLGQDWNGVEWELVVVDDGSKDATADRARAFAPRARVIRQANQGQGQAFNAGALGAKGDILCFLDGDDVWYPGKISAVRREFAAHPDAVFVQHPLQAVDVAGNVVRRPRAFPPARVELRDVLEGRDVMVGTSGLSVRRSAFERIAPVPKELTTCADEYVSKHALFFGPGRTVPEILGGLRLHDRNSFQSLNWRPASLERFLQMRDLLDGRLEMRLRGSGLEMTPEGRRARLLERQTKLILLHGWRGDRAASLSAWNALRRELPLSRFNLFKLAALLLAVVSPRAYLRQHGF
jgi:glycosyltransferase involved in cell wall biosynthesis